MPIRPELLYLYHSPEWEAARARILARAKSRCEDCGKPGGVGYYNRKTRKLVKVQLAAAHIDHEDRSRFFDDTNLKCLCRACHLKFDHSYHKQTRSTRKDKTRPLLVEAELAELRRYQQNSIERHRRGDGFTACGRSLGLYGALDALAEECLILMEARG